MKKMKKEKKDYYTAWLNLCDCLPEVSSRIKLGSDKYEAFDWHKREPEYFWDKLQRHMQGCTMDLTARDEDGELHIGGVAVHALYLLWHAIKVEEFESGKIGVDGIPTIEEYAHSEGFLLNIDTNYWENEKGVRVTNGEIADMYNDFRTRISNERRKLETEKTEESTENTKVLSCREWAIKCGYAYEEDDKYAGMLKLRYNTLDVLELYNEYLAGINGNGS